jgi:hypothetical protein
MAEKSDWSPSSEADYDAPFLFGLERPEALRD